MGYLQPIISNIHAFANWESAPDPVEWFRDYGRTPIMVGRAVKVSDGANWVSSDTYPDTLSFIAENAPAGNQTQAAACAAYGKGFLGIGGKQYCCNGASLSASIIDTSFNQFDYSNLTPTLFFDSTATSSTGAGTLANPFRTNADLQAYLTSVSGDMRGKIPGFKRGTVISEFLQFYLSNGSYADLGGIQTDASYPMIVCAYGDAADKPRITLARASTGWSTVSGSPGILAKAFTSQPEIYQVGDYHAVADYKRYVCHASVTSLATLATYGVGYAWWDNTNKIMYIYAHVNSTASGMLEEITSKTGTLDVRYKDQASTGHIQLHGLNIDGSGDVPLSIQPSGTPTAITSITGLVINDCDISRSGIDDGVYTNASSLLNIVGRSDTYRVTGAYVGNCNFAHARNNMTEVTNSDGIIFENNVGKKITGKLFEFWQSASNSVVRYCYASSYGKYGELFPKAESGNYSNLGFWVAGRSDNAGTVDGTKNANNLVAFCHVDGFKGPGASIIAGELILVNNLIDCGNVSPEVTVYEAQACLQFSSSGNNTTDTQKSATIKAYNNVFQHDVLRPYLVGSGNANAAGAVDILIGANNVLSCKSASLAVGGGFWGRWRNATITNSSPAASIADIEGRAGVTLSGTKFVQGARDNHKWTTLLDRNIHYAGAAYSGVTDDPITYGRDLAGNRLSGKHIGPYNPGAEIVG